MGGSSGSSGTTTTNTSPWSGQQPYLSYGFQQAQNLQQSGGPQYYQGNTVAAPSANTNAAYNMVSNQVQNNPLQAQSQQQVSNTLNGNYLNSNPYLDQTFNTGANQITKAYQQAVNGNNAGFEGGGRYGSGMQQVAQDNANNTLGQNLQQYAANTYNQNYQNERTNQVNAVGQAGAVQNQGLTNANMLGTVGSAQDQYNQNLVNADINKWNYNQNLPANTLGQYMGLVQGNYGGSSSTSTPTSGSNTFGQILGGLGTAASIASMFSDRRMKANVSKIGIADNGLPIYLFEYIGDPTLHLGFMADEVEQVHPEAVTMHWSGYKMVNYDLANLPVKGSA